MIVLNQDEQILTTDLSEFLKYQWEWWISDSNFQAQVSEKKLKNSGHICVEFWELTTMPSHNICPFLLLDSELDKTMRLTQKWLTHDFVFNPKDIC